MKSTTDINELARQQAMLFRALAAYAKDHLPEAKDNFDTGFAIGLNYAQLHFNLNLTHLWDRSDETIQRFVTLHKHGPMAEVTPLRPVPEPDGAA